MSNEKTNRSLTENLARIIVLERWMQHKMDKDRAGVSGSDRLFNEWTREFTELSHDHDVIAAIAKAREQK